MRYDAFRDVLTRHVHAAKLRVLNGPRETLDLTTTTRRYGLYLEGAAEDVEPFHISASVEFDWDPFESARSFTTEDDLITELFGRDDDEEEETMPRSLRVDFVLRAGLLWGTDAPLPGARQWRSWCLSVTEAIDRFLPTDAAEHLGRPIIVTGWSGDVTIEAVSNVRGDVSLRSVSLPTWRSVILPRMRDAVDEEPEVDVSRQLEDLTARYRNALDTWASHVAELPRLIRIRPREL